MSPSRIVVTVGMLGYMISPVVHGFDLQRKDRSVVLCVQTHVNYSRQQMAAKLDLRIDCG